VGFCDGVAYIWRKKLAQPWNHESPIISNYQSDCRGHIVEHNYGSAWAYRSFLALRQEPWWLDSRFEGEERFAWMLEDASGFSGSSKVITALHQLLGYSGGACMPQIIVEWLLPSLLRPCVVDHDEDLPGHIHSRALFGPLRYSGECP
jgi:hypothetical protein